MSTKPWSDPIKSRSETIIALRSPRPSAAPASRSPRSGRGTNLQDGVEIHSSRKKREETSSKGSADRHETGMIPKVDRVRVRGSRNLGFRGFGGSAMFAAVAFHLCFDHVNNVGPCVSLRLKTVDVNEEKETFNFFSLKLFKSSNQVPPASKFRLICTALYSLCREKS